MGKALSPDYAQRAEQAAEAIATASGRVYFHCYLGVHRVRSVQAALAARGVPVTEAARETEGAKDALRFREASAHYRAARYDEAARVLAEIVEPDAGARALLGWARYQLGDTSGARAAFDAALAADPGAVDALGGLGYAALREEDLASAERWFVAALARDGRDAPALAGLGFVRYRQERFDDAASYLERALSAEPADAEVRDTLARIAELRGR